LDKNGDPTSTKQTFLVIVSAEEASQAYSNTTISFYNVATDAVETRMEFDAPVTDVQCNDRFIVAVRCVALSRLVCWLTSFLREQKQE
jgi:hypothetical protein